MAQIIEETLLVKFSTLVRSDEDGDRKSVISTEHITLLSDALKEALDVPAGVVVEVERG